MEENCKRGMLLIGAKAIYIHPSRNNVKNSTFQCRVVELLYLHYYCKTDASRTLRL